jgi:hypothetical protein
MIILSWNGKVKLSTITDGTSHTLLVGEAHIRPIATKRGHNENRCIFGGVDNAIRRGAGPDPTGTDVRPIALPDYNVATDYTAGPVGNATPNEWFGGPHPGFCLFAFCDASVRAISVDININTFGHLGARNDGLPTGGDY